MGVSDFPRVWGVLNDHRPFKLLLQLGGKKAGAGAGAGGVLCYDFGTSKHCMQKRGCA